MIINGLCSVCVCMFVCKMLCVRVLYKIYEVSSEGDGRWHSAHITSHSGGFWELHMHAYKRPSIIAHRLGCSHRETYVCVWMLD